jgi:hypothetical protein
MTTLEIRHQEGRWVNQARPATESQPDNFERATELMSSAFEVVPFAIGRQVPHGGASRPFRGRRFCGRARCRRMGLALAKTAATSIDPCDAPPSGPVCRSGAWFFAVRFSQNDCFGNQPT